MDDLYREVIIEHYKNPGYRGHLDPHDIQFADSNPLCGGSADQPVRYRMRPPDDARRLADSPKSARALAVPVSISMIVDATTLSGPSSVRLGASLVGVSPTKTMLVVATRQSWSIGA